MPCGQRRSVITPMGVLPGTRRTHRDTCHGHGGNLSALPSRTRLHRIRPPRPPLSSSSDPTGRLTTTTTTTASTMRATRPLAQLLKYTLTSASPLIRVRGSPKCPPSLEADFAIYPSFFTGAESRQLLSIALWKLNRLDVTRKRGSRRRLASSPAAAAAAAATEEAAPLQDQFTGTYGFEEVSYLISDS